MKNAGFSPFGAGYPSIGIPKNFQAVIKSAASAASPHEFSSGDEVGC